MALSLREALLIGQFRSAEHASRKEPCIASSSSSCRVRVGPYPRCSLGRRRRTSAGAPRRGRAPGSERSRTAEPRLEPPHEPLASSPCFRRGVSPRSSGGAHHQRGASYRSPGVTPGQVVVLEAGAFMRLRPQTSARGRPWRGRGIAPLAGPAPPWRSPSWRHRRTP